MSPFLITLFSAGIDTLAFYSYVLKSLGFSINTVCIFTINSSYKKNTSTQDILKSNFVSHRVFKRENYIEKLCSHLQRDMASKKPPSVSLDKACFKPQLCDHFKNLLAKFFVMGYFSLNNKPIQKKLDFFHHNMVTFKQLSKISFSLSKSQQNQIESELTRTPYINHQAIRTFLNDLFFLFNALI